MKKILSILMTLILSLTMLCTAAYASDVDYNKFLEKIYKTDQDIYERIQKALDDADNLIFKYQDDLLKNMSDVKMSEFETHLNKIHEVLGFISDSNKQSDAVIKKLSNLGDKLDKIDTRLTARETELTEMYKMLDYLRSQGVDEGSKDFLNLSKKITAKKEQLENKDEKAQERAEELADKFNKDLDKIIIDLIDNTNEMAQKLIEDGRKKGIEVESVWIPVGIGGRSILVDPCRTVSR